MCRKGAGTKVGEMHTKTPQTHVVLKKKKKMGHCKPSNPTKRNMKPWICDMDMNIWHILAYPLHSTKWYTVSFYMPLQAKL